MGSSVFYTTQNVLEVVINALKPAIEVALPIAKQAGEEALKLASPVVSEASKKAQEAIQGSGVDTEPVVTAAKVYPDHYFKLLSVLHYNVAMHKLNILGGGLKLSCIF